MVRNIVVRPRGSTPREPRREADGNIAGFRPGDRSADVRASVMIERLRPSGAGGAAAVDVPKPTTIGAQQIGAHRGKKASTPWRRGSYGALALAAWVATLAGPAAGDVDR